MAVTGMNHFNILSDDLAACEHFYCDLLGLAKGERPPFKFGGLWLYAGGQPILHVNETTLPAGKEGVIDHIAFSSRDLKGTVAKLQAEGIRFSLNQQVGSGVWQLFCHDPAGVKVELDFDASEPAR